MNEEFDKDKFLGGPSIWAMQGEVNSTATTIILLPPEDEPVPPLTRRERRKLERKFLVRKKSPC